MDFYEIVMNELRDSLYILPTILIFAAAYWWWNREPPKPVRPIPTPVAVAPKAGPVKTAGAKQKTEGPSLKVFFGSQTGTAEDFAGQLAAEARRIGFNAEDVDLEDYTMVCVFEIYFFRRT